MFFLFSLLFTVQVSFSSEVSCKRVEKVYTFCGTKINRQGNWFHFDLKSGAESYPCNDEKKLSFYDRIDQMDVRSILSIPYISGKIKLPEVRQNHDPGRLRLEALLKKIFGESKEEVRKNLVKVNFLGHKVSFQRKLGAARALETVGKELEKEMKVDESLKTFLKPFLEKKLDLANYTFSWRFVSGTNRLSTHSFGTGIDLLVDKGPQYWLWDEKRANPERAKLGEVAYKDVHYIPSKAPYFHPKAVEIFEKNGFIWGGKWNHYDTMHFEYRPEFFPKYTVDCESDLIAESSLVEEKDELIFHPDWRSDFFLNHDH
ncbi:MAG: M15 family metallopeptidase [Oligoflexia bacterium]|nr:M15 family metallopeptidase [Oligoflexia bacterium]